MRQGPVELAHIPVGKNMQTITKLTGIACGALLLNACAVAKTTAKVAALPVTATYKTGELATKGVYHTSKGAGTAAYKTGELTGKGVYYTGKGTGTAVMKSGELAGKGVYYTGKGAYKTAQVPVMVMNGALESTAKVLTVTTQVVDLTGKVVTVSRNINRAEVDGYIGQARGAANVLSIMVDIARVS